MSTTYHHPDDRPSDFEVRLWDASPGVCCAAFQLGACAHTEGEDYLYDLDDDYGPHPVRTTGADEVRYAVEDDEPF